MTPAGDRLHDVELTIRRRESPVAPERMFRLQARDGAATAASTLPDPGAALEALTRHGEAIFFPAPGPPKICTQQYGGPQVAVVTGRFLGRDVHTTFSLTDGCEIARWRAMAPLLGGAACMGS